MPPLESKILIPNWPVVFVVKGLVISLRKKLNVPPMDVFESKPPLTLILYPFSSAYTKLQLISSENPETIVHEAATLSVSEI